MEKRIFIAVFASIAFLWIWSAAAPYLFPELARPPAEPAAAAEKEKSPAPPAAASATTGTTAGAKEASPAEVSEPAVIAPVAAERTQQSVVDMPQYRAVFTNEGAQLVSFVLKEYQEQKSSQLVDLVKRRDGSRRDFPFAIASGDPNVAEANDLRYVVSEQRRGDSTILEYRAATPSGVAVTKRFVLGPDYRIDFSIRVDGTRVPYRVTIGPGLGNVTPEEKDSQFVTTGNGVYQQDGSFEVVAREKAPRVEKIGENLEFVGLQDNYFLTALSPASASTGVLRSIDTPPILKDEKVRREIVAGLEGVGVIEGRAFFGPKEAEVLEHHGLESALQLGMFGVIARLLLSALTWIYAWTKNYGWAIVVLTVIIKILLYPLQHKSIVSMKRMQRLQPKMNAIKEKYKKAKTDPEQRQKMNTEMMKLYQQEGINPMSGCLPILLQLPILWAFYGLLSQAIELRGAGFFGWIDDLSAKDPYYVTPVLMTATMFIQQWMTPTTADPAQRRIFLIMPIVFGWIFKEFPSGLVLYWLVQNVLTIGQQLIMNRYWTDEPAKA